MGIATGIAVGLVLGVLIGGILTRYVMRTSFEDGWRTAQGERPAVSTFVGRHKTLDYSDRPPEDE